MRESETKKNESGEKRIGGGAGDLDVKERRESRYRAWRCERQQARRVVAASYIGCN